MTAFSHRAFFNWCWLAPLHSMSLLKTTWAHIELTRLPNGGTLRRTSKWKTCAQAVTVKYYSAFYWTGCHRFPLSNFKYCLTLFSKFFSSFPHGTCSLSVSRSYLALDEIYHPFRVAIPNNSTLGIQVVCRWIVNQRRGSHPLWHPFPKDLYWPQSADVASRDYNSDHTAKMCRFSFWALPASLAVTRGILVSFFSSAY